MKNIYFILSATIISISSIAAQASTCKDACNSWSETLQTSCKTKGLDNDLPGGCRGFESDFAAWCSGKCTS